MSEEMQSQQHELQIKRQYIEDLRKRLMGCQEENAFMQQELAGMGQMPDQQ